jgi:hypothetical protein
MSELSELLPAITMAAAHLTPAAEIGASVGLADDEWRDLAKRYGEPIRLSIALGRTQAQVKANTALITCAGFGKAQAALYALKHQHGWKFKANATKQRLRPPNAQGVASPSK